jgi:hypothetical protein
LMDRLSRFQHRSRRSAKRCTQAAFDARRLSGCSRFSQRPVPWRGVAGASAGQGEQPQPSTPYAWLARPGKGVTAATVGDDSVDFSSSRA